MRASIATYSAKVPWPRCNRTARRRVEGMTPLALRPDLTRSGHERSPHDRLGSRSSSTRAARWPARAHLGTARCRVRHVGEGQSVRVSRLLARAVRVIAKRQPRPHSCPVVRTAEARRSRYPRLLRALGDPAEVHDAWRSFERFARTAVEGFALARRLDPEHLGGRAGDHEGVRYGSRLDVPSLDVGSGPRFAASRRPSRSWLRRRRPGRA